MKYRMGEDEARFLLTVALVNLLVIDMLLFVVLVAVL